MNIKMLKNKIKALSLFANVGIAETYLSEIGIDVVLANEIDPKRVKFYKHLYPSTNIIEGDITKDTIKKEIIQYSKNLNIEMVIATPPCQGMSTAGKKDKLDLRNSLICDAIDIINEIKPKYIFLENVSEQINTKIIYNGELMLIPDYLHLKLDPFYNFAKENVVDSANYGVAQFRERAIFLLTRKDVGFIWEMPPKESKIVTLKDIIGDLPPLDPLIYDIPYEEHLKYFPLYEERKKEALSISKWHFPPKHVFRQVIAMSHTPTGKTAFDNIDKFKPKKTNGDFVKGFKNTYKRQNWDTPAFTITMYNRTIGSQNNVHPGRYIGKDKEGYDIYSDARVLTIYEIMLAMSLPKDWDIPEWATEAFIRSVIGEGIPPLLVKKIMKELIKHE